MNARGTRAQWGISDAKGATTEDPAKEVGRADLTMGKPAALVETLKIVLTHTDATHGKLDITWENVTASAPFPVPSCQRRTRPDSICICASWRSEWLTRISHSFSGEMT